MLTHIFIHLFQDKHYPFVCLFNKRRAYLSCIILFYFQLLFAVEIYPSLLCILDLENMSVRHPVYVCVADGLAVGIKLVKLRPDEVKIPRLYLCSFQIIWMHEDWSIEGQISILFITSRILEDKSLIFFEKRVIISYGLKIPTIHKQKGLNQF